MDDSVAVDAKRILLRYGTPIAVLDAISEQDRIAFARAVTRMPLAEREPRLQTLLKERGYIEEERPRTRRRR